jgi:hypothetical protein
MEELVESSEELSLKMNPLYEVRMKPQKVICSECECWEQAGFEEDNHGICMRHPPAAVRGYPVVVGTKGCFDGIKKEK